jgi:hypothetical protein
LLKRIDFSEFMLRLVQLALVMDLLIAVTTNFFKDGQWKFIGTILY